mmetsp:Transcript_18926/g.39867  ORF Transcript_18926/g.39867 Transcript_18926/m.39867 type:complete len:462 (+) Transcript_18926:141-1526(+)|eukprot:CAMPEP_0183740874 /NCGR_PEP_ID=MMETSP0737-20130205/60730_1 /TAXON_ID=385413 /ORGANISM="Thalassiosira miniscula, Strain CCMP1093" /LENGTH=461 /DNA_ID=CAMNT_0025976041 /DNA_START=117 /DNA_END=1502 /DNA_ORIENTATION=+
MTCERSLPSASEGTLSVSHSSASDNSFYEISAFEQSESDVLTESHGGKDVRTVEKTDSNEARSACNTIRDSIKVAESVAGDERTGIEGATISFTPGPPQSLSLTTLHLDIKSVSSQQTAKLDTSDKIMAFENNDAEEKANSHSDAAGNDNMMEGSPNKRGNDLAAMLADSSPYVDNINISKLSTKTESSLQSFNTKIPQEKKPETIKFPAGTSVTNGYTRTKGDAMDSVKRTDKTPGSKANKVSGTIISCVLATAVAVSCMCGVAQHTATQMKALQEQLSDEIEQISIKQTESLNEKLNELLGSAPTQKIQREECKDAHLDFQANFKRDEIIPKELWSPCVTNEVAEYFGYENRDAYGAGYCRDNGYEGASPQGRPYGHRDCGRGSGWYEFRCTNTSSEDVNGFLWTPCYRDEDGKAMGLGNRRAAGEAWCELYGSYSVYVETRDCGNYYQQYKCSKKKSA